MANILNEHSQLVAYSFDAPAVVPGFEEWISWPPNEIKVKRLTETAKLPTRSNNDAGLDLYADEDIEIAYGDVEKIGTGIVVEIPEGFYGDMRSRSSLWSRGLLVHGTIDSSYRGEIIVVMGYGCSPSTHMDKVVIKRGDKIAQMVLTQIITPSVVEVDELSDTERGSNGFGSTGS